MVKFYAFLIVLLMPLSSMAAFSASVTKEEIVYSKGKVTGYVFYVDMAKVDTIDLYKDMYRIDSLDANIFFKDLLVRIPVREIKSIKVLETIETSAYQYTRVTLTSKDKGWLSKMYVDKEVISKNYNDWTTIYYFSETSEKGALESEYQRLMAKYPLGEMAEADQKLWDEKVEQFLRNLQDKRVVMITAWSD